MPTAELLCVNKNCTLTTEVEVPESAFTGDGEKELLDPSSVLHRLCKFHHDHTKPWTGWGGHNNYSLTDISNGRCVMIYGGKDDGEKTFTIHR